jgi:hypothetical protein
MAWMPAYIAVPNLISMISMASPLGAAHQRRQCVGPPCCRNLRMGSQKISQDPGSSKNILIQLFLRTIFLQTSFTEP